MKQTSRFHGRWAMGCESFASMVKAIVAPEIEFTRLAGKAKLSQNKEQREVRNVREALIA
jgi:predicted FMN-binding regulatory protein PaiB